VCAARFAPGSRVLEIGCGVGLDASFLATRGVHVTAVDPAPGMVSRTMARLRALEPPGEVRVFKADLDTVDDHLTRCADGGRFDGILSNLGALNCVEDLGALGRLAERRLECGGAIVLCLMGRLCPWEILYFLVRGEPRRALRRLGSVPVPVNVEGIAVPTSYHTSGDVMQALGAGFDLRGMSGLAVLVPPPWLASRWAAVPLWIRRAVSAADVRLSSRFPLNYLGDHFLMDIVKR
jgi:SAM-dependent methyltransferase